MLTRLFLLAFCLILAAGSPSFANNEAVGAAMKVLVAKPSVRTGSDVADANFESIKAFYSTRSFKPVWSRDSGPKGKAKALLGELRSSAVHGLSPSFYNVDEISELMESTDPADLARMDFLFTGALIDFSHDLFNGRTTNLKTLPSNKVEPWRMDPAELVEKAAYAGNLRVMLGELVGDDRRYLRLISKLFETVQLAQSKHWPKNVDGKNIADLRKLLALSGDLPAKLMISTAGMDKPLRQAIADFQKRHGLEADGKIGPATLAEMNRPLDERIAKIQINIERRRWQNRPDEGTSLYFNLVDGQMKLTVEGKTAGLIPVVMNEAVEELPTFYGSVTAIERQGQRIVLSYAAPAMGSDTRTIELDDRNGTGIEQLAKIVDPADRGAVKGLANADGKVELSTGRELFVTYLTAWATRKGDLNYRADIYGRDGRVLKELGL
ncbi:MAG: peptidoglycan-binding protein [Rhizobiaceae bacterium]|nr:peptidoglycan-binding protein [Hyphomicrobiales bacterium]NRB32038.1 peptidoglycan-binding protein [Rhizobiaceae bacterium]